MEQLKSNMGHPESASGVAAIIKVVSAIEQGAIPPIRCLNKLNPNGAQTLLCLSRSVANR